MQCIKFTRAINGAIVVASFAVCRYLKQVTIKSRVQITKWYSKIILSWMYFLPVLFAVIRAVDKYLMWMHCYLAHSNRRHRHHHRLRYALYTIAHFCLQCHLHWNHHWVNYFPNLVKTKHWYNRRRKRNKKRNEWTFKLRFMQFVDACTINKKYALLIIVNWIKML